MRVPLSTPIRADSMLVSPDDPLVIADKMGVFQAEGAFTGTWELGNPTDQL